MGRWAREAGLPVLAAALLATLIPGHAGARGPSADPCEPIEVPTVGLACPAPGGFWVPVGDGWTFTHGGDPMPSETGSAVMPAKPRPPRCAGDIDSEFAIRVLYASASDAPNRYAQRQAAVRDMVELANGFVLKEARRVDRDVRLRVACKGGQTWVQNVILPTPLEDTTFGTVINDLVQLGFDGVLSKYWVWFDGRPPRVSAAGTATALVFDSSPGPANLNNHGPSWSVTWGVPGDSGASVMLHELGHNLGAVAHAAPNSTGRGHCIDGRDVMCYADDGPHAAKFDGSVCRVQRFDCRRDDFFHPKPKAGSYMATHWNIAAPQNRFVVGCRYRTGTLQVPLAGLDPEEAARAVTDELGVDELGLTADGFNIPKKCRGLRYAASGFLASPPVLAQQLPPGLLGELYRTLPGAVRSPEVDVCFYTGDQLRRCDTAGAWESGTVPKKATRARVILRAGAPAIYVFNII